MGGQLRCTRYAKKASASTAVVSALARGGGGSRGSFLVRSRPFPRSGRVAQAAWSSALQRPWRRPGATRSECVGIDASGTSSRRETADDLSRPRSGTSSLTSWMRARERRTRGAQVVLSVRSLWTLLIRSDRVPVQTSSSGISRRRRRGVRSWNGVTDGRRRAGVALRVARQCRTATPRVSAA